MAGQVGFVETAARPPLLGSQVQCWDLLGAAPLDKNSPSSARTPPPGWEEPLPPAGSAGDSAGVAGPSTQLQLEGRAPGRWAPATDGCTSLQTHRSLHVHSTGFYTPVLERSMERSLEPVGSKCPLWASNALWKEGLSPGGLPVEVPTVTISLKVAKPQPPEEDAEMKPLPRASKVMSTIKTFGTTIKYRCPLVQVVHTCNPSYQQAKAGGSKFQVNLGN